MLLRTLGGLELEGFDFNRHKPLLLLAYLALEGSQNRAYLADLFFTDSANARGTLSTTLSRLRQISQDIVQADDKQVGSDVESDVALLKEAIAENNFEEAIKLYKGRFLNGFDTSELGVELEEWIYKQREQLGQEMRQVFLTVAEQTAVPGQFEQAAHYAEQAYLVSGAPEPEPKELTRLFTLLTAANHPQAKEVKAEAEAYGLTLTLEPQEAQEQLLETKPLNWIPNNPYKGLAFFKEEDAELFFGREAVVSTLLSHLQRQSFLSLIGGSGSGKSSLVFAGLIPALRKQHNWLITHFRPGLHPFQALAFALLELLEPDLSTVTRLAEAKKLARLLRNNELALSDLLERFRQSHAQKKVLIVIDQFEELYTFSESSNANFNPRIFLDQLLISLESRSDFIKIILTLRADFMAAVLEYRPMVDLLQQSEYLLGPMNDDELRAVIEKPALKRGISLEDGLTERILHDVMGREGSLPLLEFALTELWDKQSGGRLTHQAYDAIGGIEHSLANHAEITFSQLNDEEQSACQKIFLQLVYPGEGQEDTRRVATHRELGQHWSLISKLASSPARLVVTGQSESGEQTAEVIHEALIRHWGQLRTWINEHRSFRIWQEHLRKDSRQWQAKKDEGYLLRGFPLEEARQQLLEHEAKLTPDELEFIQASLTYEAKEKAIEERRLRERARLRRRLTQVLSYALIIALGLVGVASWQWQNANRQRNLVEQQKTFAEEQRDEATKQRTLAEEQRLLATFRSLEGQALAAIQNDEFALASLLTAQGLKMTQDNSENRQNFLTVMLALPSKIKTNIQNEKQQEVWAIKFSPDGKLLATSGEEIFLWDVENSNLVGTLPGHEKGTRSLAFSTDGTMLVSGGEDKNIKLWDLKSFSQIGKSMTDGIDNPAKAGDGVYSVVFSPDGKYIASGGQDRTVIFWDVATQTMIGEPLDSDSGAYWINDIAYSPDGKILASTELCCDVFLWDVNKQTKIAVLEGHGNSVDAVAFSPDGKLLATSGWDETIILWDVESRQMIGEPFSQHSDGITGLAFSPDGKILVSGSRDKTIVLWDVETRTSIGEPLKGHEAGIGELAFHPNGEIIATIGVDGTTLLWDLSETQQLGESLNAHGHWVKDLVISPDNKTVVSGSWASGMFTVWDVETRAIIKRIQSGQSHLNGVAFSPDGEILATTNNGGDYPQSVFLWDTKTFELIGEPLIWEYDDFLPWELAISPDGTILAVGSWDGEVIVFWDMETRSIIGEPMVGHKGMIMSMEFSPDGSILASAAQDNTVHFWDVKSQEVLAILVGHSSAVNQIAFNPEGTLLASASEDETIILWNVATQAPIGTPLDGHRSTIYTLAFNNDGTLLASGSESDGILFWDVATGEPLGYPYQGHINNSVQDVAFSSDGSYFVSGNEKIIFWNPEPKREDWFDKACNIAGRNFTKEEWQRFLGDLPYEDTCPQFAKN